MKYIRYGLTMACFSKHVKHEKFAEDLGVREKCTSAGFIRETPHGLECYGHSISLELDSSPLDTKLLRIQLIVK